jgi:hypothetical protein
MSQLEYNLWTWDENRDESEMLRGEAKMSKAFWAAFVSINLLLTVTVLQARSSEINDVQAFAHPVPVLDVGAGHHPRLAVDGTGKLSVVFENIKHGSKIQDIFYSSSIDGGLTWTTAVDLSNTPGTSSHPDIAVEKSGAVDVVWGDTTDATSPDIYFVRSQDGGTTWTEPFDISNTPGVSDEPAIALAADNSLHVVWTDTSKGENKKDIYYAGSYDSGKTWSKDPLLPAIDISNTPGASTEPAIATDESGGVHVVWLDSTPGETHPDIYYAHKKGNAWTQPLNVSHSPRVSDHPTIGCGPKEKVYVAWLDHSQKPEAPDIWCAVASKPDQFEKPINISDTPGVSGEPSLAADNKGRVVFVWTDTSKTFRQPDIFARLSNDCTNDFTKVMDISNTPGVSLHPQAIIVDDKMVAIWEELLEGKGLIKLTSISLKDIGTGPPAEVNPTIRGTESNSR